MKKKICLCFAAALAAACLLTGCGSASYSATEEAAAYEGATAMDEKAADTGEIYEAAGGAEAAEPAEGSGQQQVAVDGRKLIKNVNLSVETTEYDRLMSHVEDRVRQLGGYIENLSSEASSDGWGKRGYITARIPADKLDGFVTEVSEQSNVISRNESVEDVTLQYVDLESHKKALLTEQERLLQFLEEAESMEDIIALESRLSEVRYQLESMESQLRTFDNQISYSTVYIDVREVELVTPSAELGAWEKISAGFGNNVHRVAAGLKNFGIGFIIILPFLFVWAVFILLLILIVRFFLKLSDKKRLKKQEKEQTTYQEAVKRMNAVNMAQAPVNITQNPVQNSVKEEEKK